MRLPLIGSLATFAALVVFAGGYDDALSALEPGAAAAAATIPVAAAPASSTAELGRQVYNYRCYFCHGYSGDAKTLATSYLNPRPRDFTQSQLTMAQIERAVREGRAGTAMKSFVGVIPDREIRAVSAFVADEFVRRKAPNTRYHTTANGWPRHERYASAFPFARGEIALDAPVETLEETQQAGRRLFLAACVSCHDRGRVVDEGPAWMARPVSYPRFGFEPGQPNTPPVDAVSSASVYAKHEVPPPTEGMTARQKRGAALFQANCAFCHGADGTGKNWIGQFMEPKARDLTQYTAASMPTALLEQRIREGLPGTSMPAWQHVLAPREVRDIAHFVSSVLYQRRALEQQARQASPAGARQ